MNKITLKAGFGKAPMIFSKDFFVKKLEDGSEKYQDGFCGSVYTFKGWKSQITDNLMTRVMVLECGKRIAIAALEIAQAPSDQVEYTQDIIGRICGISPENVWVHTTHQFGFMHRPEDETKAEIYDSVMKSAVEQAAQEAMQTFSEAEMGIGTGECHVSANKNITAPDSIGGGPYFGPGSDLETNPVMTVLKFRKKDDHSNLGYFLSYGTKPSTLCTTGKSEGNREVNTEVTGHACKLMEEEYGVPCLFCMPAAGDQYPRQTAQYYGFDENGKWGLIDIGFTEGIKLVDKFGLEMANDARMIAESITGYEPAEPINQGVTVFTFENKSRERKVPIDISAITMGRLSFVGFRQEMDCVTELQIQSASPYDFTLMISFMNGDGKYYSHKEAYDFNNGIGTWESARSAFAVGAAEEFVNNAVRLLEDIKAGKKLTGDLKKGTGTKPVRMFSEMQFGGLDWLVLDRKDGKILLFSKYVLEKRNYNDIDEITTWETCSLRKYLNEDFITRFSPEEQSKIQEITLRNQSNSKYATPGGNDTKDRVFLLSLDEVILYLGGFKNILSGKFMDGQKTWWLLRSPGETEKVAASVDAFGTVDYHGVGDSLEIISGGIRPALYIDCDQ